MFIQGTPRLSRLLIIFLIQFFCYLLKKIKRLFYYLKYAYQMFKTRCTEKQKSLKQHYCYSFTKKKHSVLNMNNSQYG